MFTIMKKTYVNPMLQVVSIKKSDIVTASPMNIYDDVTIDNPNSILAPDRYYRFGSYYEGY